jgi:formate hydrogenlyase transcriptional activator
MAKNSVFSRLRSYLGRGRQASLLTACGVEGDVLQRFSHSVMRLHRSDELGKEVTATLHQSLQVTGVALYLETPDARGLQLANAAGTIEAPPFVDAGDVPALHNGSRGGEVIPADGVKDPAAESLRWAACVPVRANGSDLGLIALGPKRVRDATGASDETVLAMVAAQLAVALQNTRYVRQIERQQATIEALQKRLEAETVSLRAEIRTHPQFADIIGSSAALQRVLRLVEKAAPTTASVLITGETGTGKELIARAIHQLSPRCAGPLVSVNCPTIPPSLAESELFGHERGAFTDAVEARPGKFELAHGGTIFLDEVAELSPDLQVKLLRVLQERETQRIGGRKVHKLDIRVVAATNRDLHTEMGTQRFREDLYYRLAAVLVHVPPLRARPEDIPMLASLFLDRAASSYEKPVKGFSADAMTLLRRYTWPGNVRELQHVVERAALWCSADIIKPEHLSGLAVADAPRPFGLMIREEKQRRIAQALAQTGGNQAAAARLLGISRSNFGRLMKTLGVRPPDDSQVITLE